MINKKRILGALTLLALVAIAVGCGTRVDEAGTTNVHGIDPKNFDTTCLPCDDFYQYANGAWLVNNPIPAEYSSWSISHEIYERNNVLLREILEDAADQNADRGTVAQKIGDFYETALDTIKIEAQGAAPLEADLARIEALASVDDLRAIIADFHLAGVSVLFDADIDQDLTNNTEIIFYATQGGLGLPDRDYYTREDDESVTLRDQYVEHLTNMFMLLGDDSTQAATEAAAVMAMETRLAEVSLTNVETRDPMNWYSMKSLDEAARITPNFVWADFFAGLGTPTLAGFSIGPEKFFKEADAVLTDVPLDDWKSYLRWNLVTSSAPYLNADFVNEDFRFYSTTLRGTEELRPRWKRALSTINFRMGEALGQLYVERAFPPEAKGKALEMVNNLQSALRTRLENLEWMSDETKALAIAKLETFTPKIGYPDKWRDYSTLEIETDSYLANVRRARAFEIQRQINKIGKPVDPTEWYMPPQMVNAYYNPLQNEIVFPAGVLQPPFFDPDIDDAVNYGAMGSVIGHEMLHGFDDQGSRFDADGNMKNWWTEADREKFTASTDRLIDQFNGYEVLDSVFINGELTLGENIADLGGLRVSFNALQLASEGKADPMVDGMTQTQRFFHSWAQGWRNNQRDEGLKLQVNTDPHSPAKYRVIGPFSNMAEFAEAFGCNEGDGMVRPADERIQIW